MRTFQITRYKPYDHIILSQDVVLNSLKTENSISNATHALRKTEAINHSLSRKRKQSVLVFGELEWIMETMM